MRTPTSLARRLAALVVTAALVTALAGCLKLDANLSIEGDTVSGTLLTTLDKQAAAQLELDPEAVFGTENDQLTSLDGVTAEPYDDGTWAGTELTFDRVDIDDLNALSEGDPEGLRILRDPAHGTYELSLVLDFSWISELEGEQIGADPEVDLAELLADFEVTVAVTFPGEVTEHNGELSGTTVTWRPQPGERSELRAVALGARAGGQPGGGQPDPGSSAGPTGPTGSPGASGAPGVPGNPGDPELVAGTGDESGSGTGLLVAGLALVLAALAGAAAGWWFLLRPRRNRQAGGNQPPEPDVE